MKLCTLFLSLVLGMGWSVSARGYVYAIDPHQLRQEHIDTVNQQLDQVEADRASPKATRERFTSEPPLRLSPLDRMKQKWTLELAPQFSYIRYHEIGLIKETGAMQGLNAILTYRPDEGDTLISQIANVYRLEASFSYGKIDYHGALQNSDGSITPDNFRGISDYLFEVRDLVGKDFYFKNPASRLTPYAGVGYRSLYDALYANKPFGYDRRIQYFYAPVGGELMTKLSGGWAIGFTGEYDIFIKGFATSYLQKIGYGNLTNTQTRGYGVRGSVKLVKRGDNYNFIIEPYVRFWHVRDSRLDTSNPFELDGQEYVLEGLEPNNDSLELGGRFGLEF